MARFFKRLAERFKPGIFERLKQSSESKKKRRDEPAPAPKSRLVSVDTETTTRGNVYAQARVEIFTNLNDITTSNASSVTVQRNKAEVIWRMWHADNNVTACTTYHDPWQQWHNCGTGSTITLTTAWTAWADEAHERYERRQETRAERRRREQEEARFRAEREAANARYLEEARAAENRRKAAEDRAMGLLFSMLNPQQQSDLKNHNHFFVNAPSGRLYRIDKGTHGNLKVIDRQTRKVVERLCVQPDGVPAGDAMLMQKLLIETAEQALRAHANITIDATGEVLRGSPEPLTGDKLALIIPLRKAA